MAVVEKSFNCDSGVVADFHNEEDTCCIGDAPNYETFLFNEILVVEGITGSMSICGMNYDARKKWHLEFMTPEGSWVEKNNWSTYHQNEVSFNLSYAPFEAVGIRFYEQDYFFKWDSFGNVNGRLLVQGDCSVFQTQQECEINNCYWYNNSCHGDWSCEIISNQTECVVYGCYWYDGSCHSDPQQQPEECNLWGYVALAAIGGLVIGILVGRKA